MAKSYSKYVVFAKAEKMPVSVKENVVLKSEWRVSEAEIKKQAQKIILGCFLSFLSHGK